MRRAGRVSGPYRVRAGKPPGESRWGLASPLWSFLKGGVQGREKTKSPLSRLFSSLLLSPLLTGQKREKRISPPRMAEAYKPPPGSGGIYFVHACKTALATFPAWEAPEPAFSTQTAKA